jgi:hypothetical protein
MKKNKRKDKMTINIPVQINKTDYVLFNKAMGKPVEGLDTIYAHESVVELLNNGFSLEEDEQFVRMTDLPENILMKYARHIAYNKKG